MKYSLLPALGSGVIALCLVAAGSDDLSLAPRHGVLLLANGELIEGTITSSGDRYDVVRKDVEIHIKRSDVAFVGEDAQACYVHKRAGVESGRVADHLDLAEWCLKNGLLDAAEQEIAAARAADATHPKIRLLEPRLKLARESRAKAPPIASGAKDATAEQLDGMARNLSAGTVESFTNTVQPMLLNYCSKSGCHGRGSAGGFRLERIPPNRLAGRHVTQRNLQSALAAVNRDDPAESKLLQAPIRPHGNMKVAVFTDREQSQYKQLVQWVYQISSPREAAARPTLQERTAPLLQTVPRRGQAPADEPAEAPSKPIAQEPEDATREWSENFPDQARGQKVQQATAIEARTPRGAGRSGRAAASGAPGDYVPKDPFDPEIFNLRFFGQ